MDPLIKTVAQNGGITRLARLYALRELARRAGVSASVFKTWRIEFGPETTSVYVQPGSKKHIRFQHAPSSFWPQVSAGVFQTARASWMYDPDMSIRSLIPDLVIPFGWPHDASDGPIFVAESPDVVTSRFDLAVSVLFSLSRWEENLNGDRDVHGRFPAARSLALRDKFLNRPVVDELGLAFEQALIYLLPTWKPAERILHVKLSHDVDSVGIPFNPWTTIGHTLRRRRPLATARDLVAWLGDVEPTYLNLVRHVVQLPRELGLDSAVYWKASPRGKIDTGYDPRHRKVQRVIAWLNDCGIESGVHPGYETFRSPEKLRREVQVMREALGNKPLGGRQDYLRWCPDTWLDWENCGLAYDSSVGYADQVGFRAGTCIPYRPWLFALNREAHLVEIPLIVMECTLPVYMHLSPRESLKVVMDCVNRCRVVGGVFTLLWHNASMIRPEFDGLYGSILKRLAASAKYDWSGSVAEYQPISC